GHHVGGGQNRGTSTAGAAHHGNRGGHLVRPPAGNSRARHRRRGLASQVGQARRGSPPPAASCPGKSAAPRPTRPFTLHRPRGLGPVLVHYLVTVLAVWAGVVAERLTIDRVVARLKPPAPAGMDTLFIGPAAECARVAASAAFAADGEFRTIGFVDVQDPPARGALGHVGDFALLLAASGAQAVVICGYLPDLQFQEVVDTALAAGCQLMSVPRAVEMAG